MKSNNYRFDKRTEQEFVNDIAEATSIEKGLMELYVDDLNRRQGNLYSYSNHGVDNSGNYIPDIKHVNSKADFILHKRGSRDRLIEIKFSKPTTSTFHLKVSQLESYIKQDCCIVMFMGVDSENCSYTILLPKNYRNYIDAGEKKRMWGKDCIRFKVKDFTWYKVNKSNE